MAGCFRSLSPNNAGTSSRALGGNDLSVHCGVASDDDGIRPTPTPFPSRREPPMLTVPKPLARLSKRRARIWSRAPSGC